MEQQTWLTRVALRCTRNRFSLALQELGKAVRTTFMLDWITHDSMQRAVRKCTTTIERHHEFAKHLALSADISQPLYNERVISHHM
jgi:TnpA family transposase